MGGRREFCTLTADIVSDLVGIAVLCVSTHRRHTDKEVTNVEQKER